MLVGLPILPLLIIRHHRLDRHQNPQRQRRRHEEEGHEVKAYQAAQVGVPGGDISLEGAA